MKIQAVSVAFDSRKTQTSKLDAGSLYTSTQAGINSIYWIDRRVRNRIPEIGS